MPADKKTVHDTGFLPVQRRLAVAVSLALMTASGAAWSAGLGRLSVQSSLGQPLRAEVEITALNRDEAATLSAKLSSPEAFRQSGLEFNAALSALRFSIERRPDGRSFVRISSTQPINEPFVDMLLELNWATGKFVREYTFLLDPPELRANREVVEGGAAQASVVAPAAAPRSAEAPAAAPLMVPVVPAPAAAPPATAAAPAAVAAATARPDRAAEPRTPAAPVAAAAPAAPTPAKPAPQAPSAASLAPAKGAGAAPADSIRVQAGDTLGGIAGRIKPAAASLDQTVVSLYQANPQAFMGNLNLLKAGAKLIVPATDEIAAIDPAQARAIVLAQSSDFSGYRGRVADTARELPADKAGQSAAGTVAAKVEDKGGAAKSQDQLKISKSGAAAPAAPGKSSVESAAAQALAEQAVARDAALKESQSRVKVLEQNVADLKKLLELKNQQFADLQKQAEATKSAAVAAPKAAEAAKASAAAPAPAKIEVPLAKTEAVAPKVEAKADAAAKPAPDDAKPDAAPKAEATPQAAVEPKPVEPKSAEPAPKPATAAKAAPAAPAAPGFMDDLMSNPLMLPGLGAILALGAGYGWYAMRRRRKVEKFEDSLIATEGGAANSLFGSTGGHTVDTSTSFASSTRNSGVEVQTTEVDPIAEAEVYIAYGRESQAEEILREALRKQPQRQAIRAKLLEIYSGRKDVAAFGALAAEMHEMAAGKNEEWPKVVTMGLAIDPDNPLYTGVPASLAPAETADEPVVAALPERDEVLAPGPAAPVVQAEAFAETVPMAAGKAASKAAAEEAAPTLDFDLDLEPTLAKAGQKLADSRATGAEEGSELARAVQGRFDIPNLDLNEPLEPAAAPKAAAPASDFADFDLDMPAAADAGNAGAAAPASATSLSGMEPETELPPLGFDLDMPAAAPASAAPAAPAPADDIRWQEMATKLDLASAYEEIGDKEGARELLDEVVTGGDASQQQKARAMLEKIA